MKLRSRLALATLAVALPQLLVLLVWDIQSRRTAAEDTLVTLLNQYLTEPSSCVNDPAHWGGPLPPPPGPPPGELAVGLKGYPHGKQPMLWAYSADGISANPRAPALPTDLQWNAREPTRLRLSLLGSDVAVAAHTGWGGDCEILRLEGSTAVGWLGAILPAQPYWLLPLVGSLAGVLLAAGSAVERIRRLTQEVQEVAAGGYRRPVAMKGDDEVAALAQAFDHAGEALQRQIVETQARENALREFLANTSHDLLLPLTVLRGHLSALQTGSGGPQTLLSAMDEAHYIGSLVHNLAAAAQMESSAPVSQPLDLCALVDRVAARHRPVATPHGMQVHHAVPPIAVLMKGDVTLIEQAANNLVYNAIRYGREGGRVAIVLETEKKEFVLRVFDDGDGVSDAQLARLCERGFRSDEARSRVPDGKGLGLSIVQRVVEVHQLRLTFLRSEFGGLEARIQGPMMDLRDA